jgi:hypothetical protein
VWRSYAMGETTIGVRTTSSAFGAWLDRSLGAHRTEERVDAEYSVVVDEDRNARGRRFHVLYQGVGVIARALDVGVVARSLLSELEARVLQGRDDGVFLHYGLARSGSVTALIPAWLVSYLSGTGRRLSKAGITLPIQRWVRIDPVSGLATPTPQVLALPADAFQDVPWVGRSSAVDAYDDVSEPVPIDAVVTYVDDMDTIAGGGRARAVYHLAERTANLRTMGAAGVEVLGRLVERAHCFETGLGRPHQMLAALASVFEHERAHSLVGGGS